MKYSVRSLFVVVTLAAVVSGFVARSRQCAEQAAFHRSQLPDDLRKLRAWRALFMKKKLFNPDGEALIVQDENRIRFHEESAATYERVSKMPWLPLSLPDAPPEPSP